MDGLQQVPDVPLRHLGYPPIEQQPEDVQFMLSTCQKLWCVEYLVQFHRYEANGNRIPVRQGVQAVNERLVDPTHDVREMRHIPGSDGLVNHGVHLGQGRTTSLLERQLLSRTQLVVARPHEEPDASSRVFNEASKAYEEVERVVSMESPHSFEQPVTGVQITGTNQQPVVLWLG